MAGNGFSPPWFCITIARQVQRVRVQSAAGLPRGVFHVHRSVCACCCRTGPCAGDIRGDIAVREEVDVVHERDRLGRVPDLHRYGRGVPRPVRALEAGARETFFRSVSECRLHLKSWQQEKSKNSLTEYLTQTKLATFRPFKTKIVFHIA